MVLGGAKAPAGPPLSPPLPICHFNDHSKLMQMHVQLADKLTAMLQLDRCLHQLDFTGSREYLNLTTQSYVY
jgi:hypothetical protein